MSLNDVDKVLEGLEEELSNPGVRLPAPPPFGDVLTSPPEAPPGPTRPATVPPPLRPRRPRQGAGRYEGRTTFDDLFTLPPDPGAGTAARGLEDKVASFRQRIKVLEAQLSKVQEAWRVREGEMDALEQLMLHERQRAAQNDSKVIEAQRNVQQLHAFIEAKKREFEAYGQKSAAVFEELRREEQRLRDQVQQVERRAQEERDTLIAGVRAAQADARQRDADVRMQEALVASLRDTLSAKDRQIEALNAALSARGEEAAHDDAAVESLREALVRAQEQDKKREAELERSQKRMALLEQRTATLEQDLADAREAYDHLRDQVGYNKERLAEAENALAEAHRELASARLGLENKHGATDASLSQRLSRPLTLASQLLGEIEAEVQQILADLFDATGTADDAPETIGRLTAQLRKALEIARRILEEDAP